MPFSFASVSRSIGFALLSVLLAGNIVVSSASTSTTDNPVMLYQGIDEEACKSPANPVVSENCQPGTEDWLVKNYLNDIEVFASADTVNAGQPLDVFVDTSASTFDIYVYRNGYYGGLGGRLVFSKTGLSGRAQPTCARAEDTGLRTCSNWSPSYSLAVGEDWVSGVYIIKVKRPDTGGENETIFVVRQDDRDSLILYQQSSTTFEAYNNFGGKSVYSWASGTCDTLAGAPRAVKVSFNRPYNQGVSDPNYYYRVEYPMIRWMEEQGYDVTYSTSMDTHRSGKPGAKNELLDHKIFLSVGHDEYWSQEIRDAITAARDAGVHLGFFTANTGYWRVRFEPDPITQETDSVMAVYKTTESGPPDPTGYPSGTWRDPQGANDPENGLFGVMYIGDNDRFYFPLRVSAEQAKDDLYRHTGLQNLPSNTYVDIGDQVVGWEWDAMVDNGRAPDGVKVVATTPVYGFLLQDAGNSANGNMGQASVNTVRYTAPSGAIVFASGTIQWSWGLGAQATDVVETDPYISQITYNILADMGAQPATPAENLIVDGSDTPDPTVPQSMVKIEGSAALPQISNIQTSITGQTMTVSWDTDIESTGQLWIGTSADHIISPMALDRNYSTRHSFTIDTLAPHTAGYFKVASTSRDWGVTISDENPFQIGGLSFTGEISNALKPLGQKGGCWLRANTTGAIILGIAGVSVVLLLVGRIIWVRRRRTLPT